MYLINTFQLKMLNSRTLEICNRKKYVLVYLGTLTDWENPYCFISCVRKNKTTQIDKLPLWDKNAQQKNRDFLNI